MANYLFTLQPTFTQGLVLGQLSVFFLLALILKYLFWHTGPEPQLIALPPNSQRQSPESRAEAIAELKHEEGDESLEWFNGLLCRVRLTYTRPVF
jgi:maintenance of morphology protein 1